METHRLSLCMIVRDEETMLPDFLTSVQGLWDELCVVDTGSSDATVTLLTEAGAKLTHRPWDDDFSAARNASLAMATGDWILYLDADERMTPELATAIRNVMSNDQAGAATVLLRDDLPGGLRRETRLLRLFRHDPDIRFLHRIHEDPTESVLESLKHSKRRVVAIDGVLEHLGYRKDLTDGRGKKERDLSMLERCLADNPDDWYSRHKMLELSSFWDDIPLWQQLSRDAWARLEHADKSMLATTAHAGEMFVIIAGGLQRSGDDLIAMIEPWRDHIPPSVDYLTALGLAHESEGRLENAAAEFHQAVALADQLGLPAAAVRPQLALARLSAAVNDLDNAIERVWLALDGSPVDPEALLALVFFSSLTGNDFSWRERYEQSYGRSTPWLATLGDHALREQRWSDAIALFTEAAGSPPAGQAAERLAQAHFGNGAHQKARDLAASLMETQPSAALGVLVCDMIAGRDLSLDVDIDQESADAALTAWVDILWSSGDTEAMTALLDRLGTVIDIFPWLPTHLRELTNRLMS